MRIRERRSRGAFPESMLDLIWILLFYFLMISTVRSHRDEQTVLIHRVPYSGAEAAAPARTKTPVAMAITSAGEVLVEGEEVAVGDLLRELESVGARGDDIVLVVDVDRDARVADLMAVEDAARAAALELLIRRRVEERP